MNFFLFLIVPPWTPSPAAKTDMPSIYACPPSFYPSITPPPTPAVHPFRRHRRTETTAQSSSGGRRPCGECCSCLRTPGRLPHKPWQSRLPPNFLFAPSPTPPPHTKGILEFLHNIEVLDSCCFPRPFEIVPSQKNGLRKVFKSRKFWYPITPRWVP